MTDDAAKLTATIKMNELKIQAIISLLTKEGVLTHKEVEQEVQSLMKDNG